jgi:hypothetical protein
MSGKQSIAALTSARLFSAICQGLTIIWFSSQSSLSELTFSLTWFSVALVLSGVSDLGFTTLIVVSGRDSPAKAKMHYGQNLTLTSLMIAILLAFSPLYFIFGHRISEAGMIFFASVLLFLIWGLLESLSESGNMYQLVEGKVLAAAIGISIRRAAALAVCLTFQSVIPLSVLLPLGLMAGSVMNLCSIRVGWNFKFSNIKKTITTLRPFALMSLLGQARNLDVPLVSAYFPISQAGAFAISSRLASPIAILAGSIGNVFLARSHKFSRQKLYRFGIATLIPPVLMVIFSSYLARIFLSPAQYFVSWFTLPLLEVVFLVAARWLLFAAVTVIFAALVGDGLARVVVRSQILFVLVTITIICSSGIVGLGIVQASLLLFLFSWLQLLHLIFNLYLKAER